MAFNKAQLIAIDTDEKDVLVSASAGTGKTAALTERIVQRIENGKSTLDKMLVTTFTKKAAGEMKDRIGKKLRDAITKEIDREKKSNLKREYYNLEQAQIGTIDSFCLNTIKKYFTFLNISPDSKIADQSQINQIFDGVLNETIYKTTDKRSADYSPTMLESMDAVSIDNFNSDFYGLYQKLLLNVDGIETSLDKTIAEYENVIEKGFFSSYWGKEYLSFVSGRYLWYASCFKVIGDEIALLTDPKLNKTATRYHQISDYCHSQGLFLNGKNIDGYKIKYVADKEIAHKTISPKAPEPYHDIFSSFAGKSEFDNSVFAFVSEIEATAKEEAKKALTVANDLKKFVVLFHERYKEEKIKRGLLEFADTNILMLALLRDEEIAGEICKKYEEVYIDECQDVSHIQDEIFDLMHKHGVARFMVGDVKQLIYSFRNSDPAIFNKYRKVLSKDQIIYFKENYRSAEAILDFANSICGDMLRHAGPSSEYVADDDLKKGYKDGEIPVTNPIPPEIHLIESPKDPNNPKKTINKVRTCEAKFVADKIKELKEKEKRPNKDFCILVRKNFEANEFVSALNKIGIPCQAKAEINLLDSPEVMFIISLLNVINCPSYDLHLAAVLKSPIFGFTLSDIAKIQLEFKDEKSSLYSKIENYTEKHDFSKGSDFITRFNAYREKIGLPADELIWYLYNETKIFGFLKNTNGSEKDALLKFHSFARGFEAGRFKGLYNFISYINELMAEGEPLSVKDVSAGDCVTIMTEHASKGLEFPVVFVSSLGGGSGSDKNQWKIDGNGYYTSAFFNIDSYTKIDTTFHDVAKSTTAKISDLADDARLTYVAITRAKECLYLTGEFSYTNAFPTKEALLEKIKKTHELYENIANKEYSFLDCSTTLKKVLVSASPDFVTIDSVDMMKEETPHADSDGKTEEKATKEPIPEDILAEIKEKAEYSYKAEAAIPSKLSVSKLKPDFLDESDIETELIKNESKPKTPSFISSSSAKSSAEIGTATHAFMQFCDFEALKKGDVEGEINRLVDKKFISADSAKIIDIDGVKNFIKSKTFEDIIKSDYLKREQRFFVSVDASDFTQDEENKKKLEGRKVLVQGIIDCIFANPDGTLTVLDYKTDRCPNNKSPEAFEKELIERHNQQLTYYKSSAETITSKKVSRAVLYSFSLSKEIEIP